METFEIRLRDTRPAGSLIFVAARASDAEAVDHAWDLLERHPEFHVAEIWRGMELLREI